MVSNNSNTNLAVATTATEVVREEAIEVATSVAASEEATRATTVLPEHNSNKPLKPALHQFKHQPYLTSPLSILSN